MGTTSYRRASYRDDRSLRSRAAALVLAVGIVVALVIALIMLGALPDRLPVDGRPLTTFDAAPAGNRSAERERAAARAKPAARKPTPRPIERTAPPPPVPVPIVPMPPDMIVLSRQDFAASDIGRIRSRADEGDGRAQASEGNGESASAVGLGSGPGGERMFGAEWVRKPTRAEMAFYLPQRQQVGQGVIACRSAPRNRVEDCRVLGETQGSGIARGLREAAWQFQIRPPRVDGKPMIGVWIQITYDLVEGELK